MIKGNAYIVGKQLLGVVHVITLILVLNAIKKKILNQLVINADAFKDTGWMIDIVNHVQF